MTLIEQFYILYMYIMCMVSGVIIVFWYKFIHKIVNLKILRPFGDAYIQIGHIKKNPKVSTFKHGDKEHIIVMKEAIQERATRWTLYYDENSEYPMTFGVIQKTNAKLMKTVMRSEVYNRFLSRYRDKTFLFIIFALIIIIGIIIGISFYQNYNLMQQIVKLKQSGMVIP